MSDAPQMHDEASSCGFSPQLEQTTTSDLVLLIRQRVLETGAPDAMLNKLKRRVLNPSKIWNSCELNNFLQHRALSSAASVDGAAI